MGEVHIRILGRLGGRVRGVGRIIIIAIIMAIIMVMRGMGMLDIRGTIRTTRIMDIILTMGTILITHTTAATIRTMPIIITPIPRTTPPNTPHIPVTRTTTPAITIRPKQCLEQVPN